MLKKIFILFLFVLPGSIFSQIYICKDGVTKFTSEAPLELIKATSNKTIGVIDAATKNVAFSIVIETFNGFNGSLQKEHFLENYMEAPKYKTADFKGKIIEDVDFSKPGVYTVRAKGIFNIHGTPKEKIVKVKITVKEKEVDIETSFDVPLEDHNIKIPKIVNQKIASVIMIEVNASLKPKA